MKTKYGERPGITLKRKEVLKDIRVANQRAASHDTSDLTGRVRSREPARDLSKASGGNAKAAQAIKDAIKGDEADIRGPGARKNPAASARLTDRRWAKAEALAEKAGGRITDSRIDRLRRAAQRGLLSPAGLPEEFAGIAASREQKRKFKEDVKRETDKKAVVRRGRTTA